MFFTDSSITYTAPGGAASGPHTEYKEGDRTVNSTSPRAPESNTDIFTETGKRLPFLFGCLDMFFNSFILFFIWCCRRIRIDFNAKSVLTYMYKEFVVVIL